MHYKKVPFYKFKSLNDKYSFIILEDFLNQKIWMPPANNLNDPFEGHFQLKNFIHNNKVIDNYILIKELLSKHGVFSFCKDYSNILMWAHYTDNHRGYCVIFKLDFELLHEICIGNFSKVEFFDYQKRILRGEEIISGSYPQDPEREFAFGKISYRNQMPIFDWQKFDLIKDEYEKIKYFYENSIGTKFQNWLHEEEYRFICNSNSIKSGGLMPLKTYIPFLKVVGLIMGSQINEQDGKIIKNLAQEYKVDLWAAECSNQEYKINIKQVLDYRKETESLIFDFSKEPAKI